MQKHLQRLLLTAAMIIAPWVIQAQGVQGCAFTTGTDATAWITLSSSATDITAIEGEDDEASSCINIGFDFYFGGFTYTQFSCNSNGRFRLGPTACSYYWTQPFMTLTDPEYNDLPFITAFGMDNTLEDMDSYVKYELVGTAPNRILVVEYLTPSEYDAYGDLVNYQIQLMEDSNRVRLVYGSSNASYFDGFQIGLAGSATDILMVNPLTHTTFTSNTSTTYDSWPGVGRYYQFTMGMPPACPDITSITLDNVSAGSAVLSWSVGSGNPMSYDVEYYPLGSTAAPTTLTSTTPNVALTGLDSNTTYVMRVRANCNTDGYGNWDSISFTTLGLPCVMLDPATADTIMFSNGTSTYSGVLVFSSWGNTMYQTIFTASELTAAGVQAGGIIGVDFGFATNSSYAKEFSIFIGNTINSSFSSSTDYVDPGTLQQVYGPSAHPLNTTGWQHYDFDEPFMWDGVSNIIICTFMNQPTGSSHTSSSFSGYYTSAFTGASLYRYKDSSPFTLANYTTSSGGSTTNYRASIHFYMGSCGQRATCAAPVAAVDSVSASTVSLSWLPGYQETQWALEYRVHGTNTAWTPAGSATTTTATITGLAPATNYDIRVISICGDDSLAATVTALTDCVPISQLPYTYGFEDITTGSGAPLAVCWDRGYLSGSSYNPNNYPYGSTSYSHSGSQSVYAYASSTTTRSWLCLPEFEDSVNTLQLRFWAKKSSTSYSGLMKVGVMTDPTDWNTFTPVSTVQTDYTTDWQQFIVALNHAPAQGRITIAVVSDNGLSNYMYIDDITVDELPFCITPIIDSVVTTTTSADFYLSDIDNAVGFTMQISHGGTNTTVTGSSSPISVTSLNPGTEYTYSLVANCGAENSSPRTGSFRTVCLPIANSDLPFTYGFEDIAATGSGVPLAPCWSRGYYSGSYNPNSYPYASTSYAYSGSKSLYFYGYSTTTRSWVCLPEFEDSINTLQLQFFAKKSSDSYSGVIKVGVMTDPTNINTFQMVKSLTATNGTDWNRFDFPLSDAPGTGYITILVDGGGTSSNYIYLDDITVGEIPPCPHVWNPRVDSVYVDWASISWSEMGTATTWVVEYDTVDFVPGTYTAANTDMVYDTTLLLTGLDTGYTYHVYIRADCSGDTSTYESLVFTTLAGLPATVPYLCTFEGNGTNGWDLLNGTQTNQWYVGTATNHGGSKSLYISDNGGSTHTYTNSVISYVYATRTFNFEDTGEYVYSYDWKCQGESHNYDYARMFITPVSYQWTAGINPASSTYSFASWSIPSGWYELTENFSSPRTMSMSSSWRSVSGSFTLTTPGTYNLVIAWANDGSGGSQPPFAIDNIQVARNTCPMPTNVTATTVSSTEATITWTAGGNENQWVVINGLTEDVSYSNSYTFTGLQPNTNYTFGVRAICSGDDSSMAATVSVLTDCGGISAFPFVEDFENQNTTSSSTDNSTFMRCWHHLNNGTSYMGYPYISSSTAYNHTPSGTKGLYWYGTTTTGTYGDYYYIVLPAVDTDLVMMNTLRLRYWAKASSTSYHPVFNVGVMTDPTDVNTFQLVSTQNINPGSSTNWAEFTTEFENFTGNGAYIAIRALRPTSTWTAYMDDITLDLSPDCPEVSDITASSISTNSAEITWTENGEATSWDVEYGEHGFTRGTGVSENVSTLPYSIGSLTANTLYDIYISPTCTGTTGTRMMSFRTECEPTATIPFTMSFEANEGVNTTTSTSPNSDFITCWHHLNNGSQYYGYPYIGSSTTYAHTGSRGLYWYNTTTTGTYGDYMIVVLPPFDVDEYPINTLQLKFWAKASSSSYTPSFMVGVMTNPNEASSFQLIGIVNVDNSTMWNEYTTVFADYTGAGQYIAIRSNRASWTAYLDDITLEAAPLCPTVDNVEVSDIGTTSALLRWGLQTGSRDDVVEEYEIEVYDNVTNTVIASTTDTNYYFFITGMQPLSSYTAKVRAVCGSDGNGEWDSITFATPCPLGGNVPIVGTGTTTTTYYLPLNNYYNYSYTQQIILSNELNGPTTIYGIRFKYNYSTAVSNKSNCTIYVGHTTLSSLSTSSFVNPATLTAVYTGPMNVHNGWNEFTFSTPFAYDGTQNIVIAVDDNSGSYPGSSYVYEAYNCSGTLGMYYYSDSENPDPTSTSTLTGFSGSKSTASYRVAMELVMPCDSNPTCVPPNVVVTEVDANNITAYWGAGMSETSWLVEYRPADSSGWNTIGLETDNSHVFSGLTPNTDYQIRVTTLCSDTDMATIVNVRTACAPTPVPFHENFATFSTSTADPLPSCWIKHTNYSSNYPYASTSYSMSGGRSMYMYSTSTTYTYMVLPTFDAPIDSLQVSFWLYKTNTSYTHELHVGVMTDPDDVNTFEMVGIAVPEQLSTWEAFEIPLNNYHGTGQYIAIMSPNGQYSYPYLDELSVEYISPCPRVRNVHSSRVGLHSALISWDTTAADNYELEYGPAGFAFGTGTRITGLTDDTLTISGLAASSQYDVYVRGLCLPDTGNWSFAHSFYTVCGMIDTLPFFEDFDHIGTGTSIHSPQCWVGTSTVGTSYPYPSTSYSRNGAGGAAMYMYLSNTNGYYTMLQLPAIDTTVLPINTVMVGFSLLSSTTSYTQGIVVGVCSNSGMQDFTPVDTVVVTAPVGQWQDFEIPLNNYSGYGSYITFLAYAGSSTTCYPYLDNILITPVPSCIRPDSLYTANATSTTVQLGWRERGTATEWEIEYGPTGFTPGTGVGTTVVTSANPVTLTSMPASFEGDFYVRSICAVGDTSFYNQEGCRFTTSQLPATIPYHCNFENATEWNAWQTSSNTYINWARGTAEVDSGTYSMYISPDGGTTYGNEGFTSIVNAAIFRDVDFGPVSNSFTLTYRAKVGGTVSARYDALMVFLVDPAIPAVPSNSGITSPWGNVNDLYRISLVYLDTNWNTYTSSFDTISGVKRVAFFWFNQNTGASYPFIGGPAAVDNIHIDYSACPRPVNLDTISVTNTTATLHWDGAATDNYRVAYRVAGASASTNVYVNTSTNSITLTGLDPMTTYRAWVQKLCGTDSSLFSDGVEFQTDMCADAVTTLNYDPTWSTTTSSYGPIGYSFYNYSYVQTLIDSAQMAGFTGPITAMEFNPVDGSQGNYFTNMDIYLANVPESDLSSGFIVPDANHIFVQVTNHADLSYTDGGWHVVGFDTTFTWDGHSNVLVASNRHHGSYSSGATFHAHNTTGVKTRYIYQDSGPYSITSPGTGTTANYVGDLRFVSCGSVPVCHEPIITGLSHTFGSATVTWSGDGNNYEVNIKENTALNWPTTDIVVTGNTYTFNGLMPATDYIVRVRQDCSIDTLGYSDWVETTFTTDSLPCIAPSNLHATAVTNTTATLDWTVVGDETNWDIHVWFTGGFDSIYRVNTHPATVGGFVAGLAYHASIRALCGTNLLEGDWGDTITFSTATCPDVTGLTSSNVTTNSVTLNWNNDPMAESWIIEYGYEGFNQGTGITATATSNSYVVTGLTDDSDYEFYVKAVCGTNWNSENWVSTTATTLASTVPCDEPTGVTTAVADNSVTVNWTANTGNISFEIEYGTHGFNHGAGIVTNATASPAVISNLEYETDYDIYVRAVCDQNTYSDWSTVATFTTGQRPSEDCNPVTDLAVSNITDNAAVVTWTPGAPDDNNWQVVLTDDHGNDVLDTYRQEPNITLSDLTPGTNYVVKVRTVCADNNFSAYVSVNFRTTGGEGIDNVSGASCSIYPNPTSNSTTVSVSGVNGKVKIEVVDMNGRTVASETLECSSECVKTMDVNNLAQGAYFVRITGDNTNMVKKLIVR